MNAEGMGLARRFVACERWEWLPGMLARLDGSDGAWMEWTEVAGG